MRWVAAIAAIWLLGLADLALSAWFVEVGGAAAESNPVAGRCLALGGVAGLAALKCSGLAVFTTLALGLRRWAGASGLWVTGAGLAAHLALGLWWGVVLYAAQIVAPPAAQPLARHEMLAVAPSPPPGPPSLLPL